MEIYERYINAPFDERVDIIIRNYGSFMKRINRCTEGILYMLMEELEYNTSIAFAN